MKRGVIALGAAVIAVCLATAWAQDTSPPVVVEGAAEIDMSAFCAEHPSTLNIYPRRALQRSGMAGHVVLDCALNGDDTVRSCRITEETPPHYGFGDAALTLACRQPAQRVAAEAGDPTTISQDAPEIYTSAGSDLRRQRWTTRFTINSGGANGPGHGNVPSDRRLRALVATCENANGRGSEDEVVQACTRIIRDDLATTNGTAQAYGGRGNAHYNAGHFDLAVADFTDMVRLAPQDPNGYYNLALANHARGNIDSAIPNYDRAIALGYNGDAAYAGRCRAHLMARQVGPAAADCRQALAIAPNDVVALDGLGVIQLMQQDYQGAWSSFAAAARLEPNDAYHLYGRGLAAVGLGRRDEGHADMARAASANDSAAAYFARYGVTAQ